MADRYASVGKLTNRARWAHLVHNLAFMRQRPLDMLWLSNDRFSDLIPVLDSCRRVIVPELDADALRRKQRFLCHNPLLAEKIQVPFDPTTAEKAVQELANWQQFDVINLDYCGSFSPNVERTLGLILRRRVLRPNGLLFLTVANQSRRHMCGSPDEKTIARNLGRIDEQVYAEFALEGWIGEPLPEYPMVYKGHGEKNCQMFAFGWTLQPEIE